MNRRSASPAPDDPALIGFDDPAQAFAVIHDNLAQTQITSTSPEVTMLLSVLRTASDSAAKRGTDQSPTSGPLRTVAFLADLDIAVSRHLSEAVDTARTPPPSAPRRKTPSWSTIAAVLGTSKQAAWERFSTASPKVKAKATTAPSLDAVDEGRADLDLGLDQGT